MPLKPRGRKQQQAVYRVHIVNRCCRGALHAAKAAPRRMKVIPFHWRGVGVGCYRQEGPTPKAEAFRPSQEGIFRRGTHDFAVAFVSDTGRSLWRVTCRDRSTSWGRQGPSSALFLLYPQGVFTRSAIDMLTRQLSTRLWTPLSPEGKPARSELAGKVTKPSKS